MGSRSCLLSLKRLFVHDLRTVERLLRLASLGFVGAEMTLFSCFPHAFGFILFQLASRCVRRSCSAVSAPFYVFTICFPNNGVSLSCADLFEGGIGPPHLSQLSRAIYKGILSKTSTQLQSSSDLADTPYSPSFLHRHRLP